jgi:hypothetical protein
MEKAEMRCGLALAAMATLTACAVERAPRLRGLTAQQLWAIHHPRSIDLAVGAAAAKAEARCGGPVDLVVEGDPADFGWDPSHYQCRPR